MTTPLTQDETSILYGYARGQSITQISKELELPMPDVSAVITGRAGLDRGRARELVATASGRPQRIPPPRPVASPVFRPPPATPAVQDRPLRDRVQTQPAVVITRAPVPEPAPVPVPPVQAPVAVPRSTVDAILAAGETHGQAVIRNLAGKARALITDLQNRLLEEEREAQAAEASRRAREEAAARVKQLEAELAAARAEAKAALRRPRAGRSQAPVVRAWAREAGVACPDRGVVPQAVVDAYEAAHARS